MDDSTTYLLLIRHGENDWVGSNRLAGRTPGVHLNEKGVQQAQCVGGTAGRSADPGRLFQPVGTLYGDSAAVGPETRPAGDAAEEGVLEVDYGEWRGQNLKDLAKDPAWKMVQHYPSGFRFPDGETLQEVQQSSGRHAQSDSPDLSQPDGGRFQPWRCHSYHAGLLIWAHTSIFSSVLPSARRRSAFWH